MFLKGKYLFNEDSLQFLRVRVTLREKVYTLFKYAALFILIAIFLNILFSYFFESPKEQNLIRKKQELITQYDILNDKLNDVEKLLNEIEQRDDQIYRPIFGEAPIPSTIREAGIGGVNRYEHLEKLSESKLVISSAIRIDKFVKKLYVQSKSYDKIIALAQNKDKMLSCIPSIQPVSIKDLNRVTSYFGRRYDPFTGASKMHDGMDFSGSIGTDIYATGDGKISVAEYSRVGYGNMIEINHGYGYTTRYAHLKELKVSQGQTIKRGEIIGALGNTGRSTGPHLHYEVRKLNHALNPINFYFNDITAEQYEEMVALSSKEGGNTMD